MLLKKPVYLLGLVRTPIGSVGGNLSSLSAADLAVFAVNGALEAAEAPARHVDHLVLGNVAAGIAASGIARQTCRRSGLSERVAAHCVNTACGSGMQAIIAAARMVQLEEAACVVAGGAESMSKAAGLFRDSRSLTDPVSPLELFGRSSDTVQGLMQQYALSPSEQAGRVTESRRRFEQARQEGRFASQIAAVCTTGTDGVPALITGDEPDFAEPAPAPALGSGDREAPRPPARHFIPFADGAAAALVVDERMFCSLERFPACELLGYAAAGGAPSALGTCSMAAVKTLLGAAGLSPGEVDLIELHELFSGHALVWARELRLDSGRVNSLGDSACFGNPIGCSGARIVVTLSHAMEQGSARYGIAAVESLDGTGVALLLRAAG